jgi:hypothetical protein
MCQSDRSVSASARDTGCLHRYLPNTGDPGPQLAARGRRRRRFPLAPTPPASRCPGSPACSRAPRRSYRVVSRARQRIGRTSLRGYPLRSSYSSTPSQAGRSIAGSLVGCARNCTAGRERPAWACAIPGVAGRSVALYVEKVRCPGRSAAARCCGTGRKEPNDARSVTAGEWTTVRLA